MNTPLDQDIRNRLIALRGEWPVIATSSGISHSWISKFVRGQIPNPGYTTLTRLAECLGIRGFRRTNVGVMPQQKEGLDRPRQEASHA